MHSRQLIIPMLLITALVLVVASLDRPLLAGAGPKPAVEVDATIDLSDVATPVAPRSRTSSIVSESIISDDFNACSLNSELWTYTDPYAGEPGESMLLVEGYTLDIKIPDGIDHGIGVMPDEDLFRAPSVMQVVEDIDFSVDVRFNSGVSETIQMQGVLARQDLDDFLTIGVQSDAGGPRLVARQFTDGVELEPSAVDRPLSTGDGPLYLRVQREADQWTVKHTYDGLDWSKGDSFTHALSLSSLGIYGGNSGLEPPTHTLSVDYFFDSAAPIVPQDGMVMYADDLTIEVDPKESGIVVGEPISPTLGNPDCGNPIRLTAQAAEGWEFEAWFYDGQEESEPTLEGVFSRSDVIEARFRRYRTPTPTATNTPTVTMTPTPTPTATSTPTPQHIHLPLVLDDDL